MFKAKGKGKKQAKEFAFEGCWHILKDALKWKGRCRYIHEPSKISSKKKVEPGAEKEILLTYKKNKSTVQWGQNK